MKRLDRVIMIVLLIGVWALVLKPTTITAHDDNTHSCDVSGYGEIEEVTEGGDVYMGSVSVDCSHY